MTLTELGERCFGIGKNPACIYIFKDEDSIDNFANGDDDYEIMFCVQSVYNCRMYLKPEYANAKVEYFYAVDKNTLAAWITPLKEEKTND